MSLGLSSLSIGGERPDPFPTLEPGIVSLDVEHKGLGREARPVGIALSDARASHYFAFAHPEGLQYSPDATRAYLSDVLSCRDVAFRAAKNDIEVLRRWGLDLEALGVIPHEIAHCAALLDDSRRIFTLERLAQDRLGQGKIKPLFAGRQVPPSEIPDLPSHVAAPYARRDSRLTYDLWQAYQGDIAEQKLERVLKLEDDLLYCTLSMERAMVKLDVPKLQRWIGEVREAYAARILEIYRRTGIRVNPNSSKDLVRLFKYLGQSFGHTLKNNPTFTDEFLNKHLDVAEIKLVSEARDLDSLLTKYLEKYLHALLPGDMLPYQLHQLRADEFGTITGRYASSKVNTQQVFKPTKQIVVSPITKPWIIRELFIPGSEIGWLLRFTVHDEVNGDLNGKWFHADASQIEYRLFAHFSNVPPPHSTRIIDAYKSDPNMSYHKFVHKDLLKECMIYDHAKNFNFMKLYGGGVDKAAWMLGTDDLGYVQDLLDQYDAAIPEAGQLLRYCSKLAERRGYVRTILGRRRRYSAGDRFYSALNSVLQGSAADLMKLKLLRLYEERKNLNSLNRLGECFMEQEFKLRVPIAWECSTGANWKETL